MEKKMVLYQANVTGKHALIIGTKHAVQTQGDTWALVPSWVLVGMYDGSPWRCTFFVSISPCSPFKGVKGMPFLCLYRRVAHFKVWKVYLFCVYTAVQPISRCERYTFFVSIPPCSPFKGVKGIPFLCIPPCSPFKNVKGSPFCVYTAV